MDRSEQMERVARMRGSRGSGEMPRLATPAVLLVALYVCVCMAYPALRESQMLGGIVLLFTAAMAVLLLRSPFVIGVLAVPAFLLIVATGSVTSAAVPLALLCGIGFGAFLILTARSAVLLVVPALAFAAGYLATGEIGEAAMSLLCLPAAIVLAQSFRHGVPRTRAICRVGSAVFLTLLLAALCYVLPRYGAAVFENFAASVDSARQALAAHLANWHTGTGENAARVVLEGMEFALAGALFNILPGVLLAVLAVFGYLADLICLTLFRTYEWEKYLSGRVFVLIISVHAAALFLIGYLVLLAMGSGGSASEQFVAVVVENFYLALLPAMIFAGALCCIRTYLLSHHRLILLVGFILLVALSPALAFTGLSLLGAGDVIWRRVRRKLRRMRRRGDE